MAPRLPLVLAALLVAPLLVAPLPTAASSGGWDATIQLSLHGDAGEWVLIYHRLPAPVPQNVSMHARYTFDAASPDGSPYGVALTPVAWIDDTPTCCDLQRQAAQEVAPDGRHVPGPILDGLRLTSLADGAPFESRFGEMGVIYDAPGRFYGFAMLAGATAPWSLNLTLQMIAGPMSSLPDDPYAVVGSLVAPSYLYAGRDMLFVHAPETRTWEPGLPAGYTAGKIDLHVAIPSEGWTHAQYDWTNALDDWGNVGAAHEGVGNQRVGAHSYDVTFPNGFHEVSPAAVEVMEPATYFPIPLRSVGAQEDAPGDFHARILRADNSTNVSLDVVHLPMPRGALPDDLETWSYDCQMDDFDYHAPYAGLGDCKESDTSRVMVGRSVVN